MKKFTLVASLLIISITGFSKVWIITASSSSQSFTPSTITINFGDSVNFSIASSHDAVEVSLATWNVNGNTPLSGGFSLPNGGGLVLPAKLTVGTHYFVCSPHANLGMKGTITVNGTSGIEAIITSEKSFYIFPSIVSENVNVRYHVTQYARVEIKLRDLLGNMVAELYAENDLAGDYERSFRIDHGRISSGIYIAEIIIGEKRSQQKILVQ